MEMHKNTQARKVQGRLSFTFCVVLDSFFVFGIDWAVLLF